MFRDQQSSLWQVEMFGQYSLRSDELITAFELA